MAKVGDVIFPDVSLQRPVTSFESPPGKAGFRVSRLLLPGGRPPDFDQLFQYLAAITQAMAFLKLIKIGDGFARQIGDELKTAFGGNAAPIRSASTGVGIFTCLHIPPRAHQIH